MRMKHRSAIGPGQLAVVTGAANGIGRALAEQLAVRGARLVLADTNRDRVQDLAETLGASAAWTDVGDPDAMERLAADAAAAQLVCLNAGVVSSSAGPVWEATPSEWERVLRVNLGGAINGLRSFVPRLLEHGHPSAFLITASLAGLATWPGGGPYAASKHGVIAVAEQAALSLIGTNIAVTVLCPALVRTGMSEIGDDPINVAVAALEAVVANRFALVPDEWQDAVRQRGLHLASGAQPEEPRPLPL